MHTAAAVGLVGTGLAVMGSPGPSTVSLVAVTAAYGFRPALAYCAGLIAGTTVVLLTVAMGVTAALLAVPGLRWVLVTTAVVYVVWLAARLSRSSSIGAVHAVDQSPSVFGGLMLGGLNPKAWLAIGAVFTGTRLSADPVLDAAGKVGVLTLLIVVIHAGWLAVGRLVEPLLREPRRARAVNVALAGLLVLAVIPVLVP